MAQAAKQNRPHSVPSASLEDRLAQLERVVHSQQEEIDRLRATREEEASVPARHIAPASRKVRDDKVGVRGRSSRRALLKLGGVAAAAG
ncbi:MAG TPA: hypothetical protein VF916_01035, partial [Ktedonobacterales bacterium]